ncbi:hypothetical protein EW145_g2423 [Phellinidium pouzarii]|uniref:Major facilitator superfamily (MFS) profile domain-containing protein n=1 Tax=Phellinidium pouzarii TaxID=167371 RepID=A0A4S4LBE0_9AGAM|nr:hypothetical protein EW145_g2423 [Phellinidium pouzarii]
MSRDPVAEKSLTSVPTSPSIGTEMTKGKAENDAELDSNKVHIVVDEAVVHVLHENESCEIVEIDERRLMRRIDLALLPWLSFLYLLSYLDRASIGNARVPSNIILKNTKPSIWLSTIMILWGAMMIIQGLVHNYGGLVAVRWMLGVFEAGFYPGAIYCLSHWYRRNEIGFRFALFSSASQLSGAFGGLLVAAINDMDGIGGKPTWAWVFILEGLTTIVAAVASFYLIHDFPDTARFLTPQERFSATHANLLTIPVYVVACVCTCSTGFFADHFQRRGYFSMTLDLVAATGYIILIFSRSAPLSYFAVFLAAVGIFPTISNQANTAFSAWISNNIEGSYKRGVTIALANSLGGLQGVVGSNVYRARDTPWYAFGHGIMLTYIGIGFFSAVIFHVLLRRENARRERGERDEVITGEGTVGYVGNLKNGCYESVAAAMKDKGDEWSGYRYIL